MYLFSFDFVFVIGYDHDPVQFKKGQHVMSTSIEKGHSNLAKLFHMPHAQYIIHIDKMALALVRTIVCDDCSLCISRGAIIIVYYLLLRLHGQIVFFSI